MLRSMNQTMDEAMQLMRNGDLHAATRAIQRGLGRFEMPDYGRHGDPAGEDVSKGPTSDAGSDRVVIEGACRIVGEDAAELPTAPGPGVDPGREPASGAGEFREHRFRCEAGTMHYKLFIPAGLADPAPPLLVMLHGCTQSPDDFARGTRMNHLARQHGYVVAYPAQTRSRNPSRCWNWFRSRDQQRGQGEPALIAALTRHLVKTHGLDERRVYVAGLSAGGAMATVLAGTYPDVFAAIGAHSGLPFGAAHDLPSAFAAMRQRGGAAGNAASLPGVEAVPAIVFHGDRDTTVDPCNGSAIVAQCVGTPARGGDERPGTHASVERGSVPGGRSYSRTLHRNAAGKVVAEQWLVEGGGHAWFGGDASGTHTDPSGPDASEQMLRFFSTCARGAIN